MPADEERVKLEALLKLTSILIGEPISKLITHNPGNAWYPENED